MKDDQAIRDLVATWHRATATGDLPRILTLMAEDAVFLTPGNPPMRGREAFAANFRAAFDKMKIESTGEVEEVQVLADWAYCSSRLSVTMTPREGGAASKRSGYTLTVLRKTPDGAWVLYRDANMLAPDAASSGSSR
jgi:uncharacterized protein (TIGR02246 family)